MKTEKGQAGKKEKSVHHITRMGSLFSPLPDVTVLMFLTDFVPVFPSSVVTEFCDCFSCYSGWEDVVPQSFSFSKKREHILVPLCKKG